MYMQMFCFVNGIPPGYSTLCGVSKHIVVKSKSIECAKMQTYTRSIAVYKEYGEIHNFH